MERKIMEVAPGIEKQEILFINDDSFNPDNVCIVTGSASGAGRAITIAAAANNLMTVGIDMDEAGGKETQRIAREMGGQTIFIKVDYCSDQQLEFAVNEAAKMGAIRYLANITPMPEPHGSEIMSLKEYDYKYKLMMRMPFFLSRRILRHMMTQHDKTAVIGNIQWKLPAPETLQLPGSPGIVTFGTRAHTNIRDFTITSNYSLFNPASDETCGSNNADNPLNRESSHQCLPGRSRHHYLDIANMFIFGFSRFAVNFKGGEL
ncbi:MAG: SDR family NAD(P)-dependent oxidoreductase [Desulfobacterium sp.]|nr:SDR family NAD(P)-dependent oxidoreductase [Desulfobacterium sp.]